MPLFPTFNDLKAVTSSINPLNLFSETPRSSSFSDHAGSSSTGNSAEAGPGPSSSTSSRLQQAQQREVHGPNGTKPIRPSLKANSTSSESDSYDYGGRRKSGGGHSVVIHEEERPRREREKKKKVNMDQYIIVKPAPTASKNPLNLQIQLVVPKSNRSRSDSTATATSISPYSKSPVTPRSSSLGPPGQVDITNSSDEVNRGRLSPTPNSDKESPTGLGHPIGSALKRSGSRKSSVSTNNTNNSSASVISTASASTLGASQKRIQPMLNLNVHNVMQPTVVTDAGTDAKVAKFLKRSIEIVDVGTLEPSEIWSTGHLDLSSSSLYPTLSGMSNTDEYTTKSRPNSIYSVTNPISPINSRLEEISKPGANNLSPVRASLDNLKLRPEMLAEGSAGAKKLFGKIGSAFKKKSNTFTSESDLIESLRSSVITGSPKLGPSTSSTGTVSNVVMPSSTGMLSGGSGQGGGVPSGPVVEVGHQALSLGSATYGCSPIVVAQTIMSTSKVSLRDNLLPVPEAHRGSISEGPKPTTTFASPSTLVVGELKNDNETASIISQPFINKRGSRPIAYHWTVKKWHKKNLDTWNAHLIAARSQGIEVKGNIAGDEDDVVFEWVKQTNVTSSEKDRSRRRLSIAGGGSNRPRSRASTFVSNGLPSPALNSTDGVSFGPGTGNGNHGNQGQGSNKTLKPIILSEPRPNYMRKQSASAASTRSVSSSRSQTPATASSASIPGLPNSSSSSSGAAALLASTSSTQNIPNPGSGRMTPVISDDASQFSGHTGTYEPQNNGGEGSDDSEDPEDCEIPWICNLHIKKTNQITPVATLIPALHHPKVVGQLKIPAKFDLFPIVSLCGGLEETRRKVMKELNIREEAVKDTICVTALWLVAREEWGGLGKKKKGI